MSFMGAAFDSVDIKREKKKSNENWWRIPMFHRVLILPVLAKQRDLSILILHLIWKEIININMFSEQAIDGNLWVGDILEDLRCIKS